MTLQPRTSFRGSGPGEESCWRVTGEPTSSVPSPSVHPELMQRRRCRRRIIALTLTLVLAAILVAFFVFGPPSVAASGGCGGG